MSTPDLEIPADLPYHHGQGSTNAHSGGDGSGDARTRTRRRRSPSPAEQKRRQEWGQRWGKLVSEAVKRELREGR